MTTARKFAEQLHRHWVSSDDGPIDDQGVSLRERELQTGERIFNLKRMLGVRRGISRKDDILPMRILTHKLVEGGTKGNLPHLGLMLNEYYTHRGWSEEGIPTRGKLVELGLEECI